MLGTPHIPTEIRRLVRSASRSRQWHAFLREGSSEFRGTTTLARVESALVPHGWLAASVHVERLRPGAGRRTFLVLAAPDGTLLDFATGTVLSVNDLLVDRSIWKAVLFESAVFNGSVHEFRFLLRIVKHDHAIGRLMLNGLRAWILRVRANLQFDQCTAARALLHFDEAAAAEGFTGDPLRLPKDTRVVLQLAMLEL